MTLFKGLLILLVLFNVAVNQGSAFVLRTTLGADRGAKAAADAGNRFIGIMVVGVVEVFDGLIDKTNTTIESVYLGK